MRNLALFEHLHFYFQLSLLEQNIQSFELSELLFSRFRKASAVERILKRYVLVYWYVLLQYNRGIIYSQYSSF